jgi:hypothetical protein
MTRRLTPALMPVLMVVAAALIAMGTGLGVDYANPSWIGNDAASGSIEALVHGNLHRFAAEQPMMGSFSLFVRAPFAALAPLGGSHQLLLEYRLGAFACVLALGLLGLVVLRLGDERRPALERVLLLGLLVAGPLTFKALYWGHPEELLAAALAIGGVIAAPRRPLLAGLLIGLAIATKQWAWLALIPALATTPRKRLKLIAIAGAMALLWALPMAIGDLHRFLDQMHAAGHTGPGVTPSSVWWPFGHEVSASLVDGKMAKTYTVPVWISRAAEPLVLGLALALSAAYWRVRRERPAVDALALLALVLLVRCMLDPLAISYHNAPFIIALATWEGLRRRGLPYVTLAANGAILVTAQLASQPDLLNAAYLAWTVPMTVYLGMVTLGRRDRRAAPAPAAATTG